MSGLTEGNNSYSLAQNNPNRQHYWKLVLKGCFPNGIALSLNLWYLFKMEFLVDEDQVLESPLSFTEIEQFAERVAQQFNFDYESEGIRDFAERVGASVTVLLPSNIDKLESGSLVVHGEGSMDIFLSPSTSTLRDNFTIAHELGHYFLHSGNPCGSRHIQVNRYGTDRCEQQANRFAAALLMPASRFREVSARFNNDLYAVASWFKVSVPAIKARQASLGIG